MRRFGATYIAPQTTIKQVVLPSSYHICRVIMDEKTWNECRAYAQELAHSAGLIITNSMPNQIASNISPHSWQLKGASKMRYLEQSSFKEGILGDEMGLGKTLVATARHSSSMLRKPMRSCLCIVTGSLWPCILPDIPRSSHILHHSSTRYATSIHARPSFSVVGPVRGGWWR